MSLEQFLSEIKPGLTFYALIVAFAIGAFSFWRFLWKYEKELRAEHIEQLRDLIRDFRDRNVEPVLKKQLTELARTICVQVIQNFQQDVFLEKLGPKGRTIELRSQHEIADVLKGIKDGPRSSRVEEEVAVSEKKIDDILVSEAGSRLLTDLDRSYERQSALTRNYRGACRACSSCAYSSILLSVALLLGLFQALGKWPEWLRDFWILGCVELAVLGVASFVWLEFNRRRLSKRWEELQLYGNL